MTASRRGRFGVAAALVALAATLAGPRPAFVEEREREEAGTTALVVGRVRSSRSFRTRAGLSILEALVADDSGTAVARWFWGGISRS